MPVAKTKTKTILTEEKAAELIRENERALSAFEKAYTDSIEKIPDNYFQLDAKTASETADSGRSCEPEPDLSDLVHSVTRSLLNQTAAWSCKRGKDRNGKTIYTVREASHLSTRPEKEITVADLRGIPSAYCPQLLGNAMKKDLRSGPSSSDMLLLIYRKYLMEQDRLKKKTYYNNFRQGMDIIDLDEKLYAMLFMNQNAMSHWLPQVLRANEKENPFLIPDTTIAIVPIQVLQMSRLEYTSLTPTTMKILNKWAESAFDTEPYKKYFIKTGTYSDKFNFRNAKITKPEEVSEIGSYLTFIQNQANTMAFPLTMPHPIYGASTTNEYVVREYISDKENNPYIYHGMPLHTEYRLFIDADKREILSIVPYWDPATMKNRFTKGADAEDPDMIHDAVIFMAHEDTLMQRYNDNKNSVLKKAEILLQNLQDLHGQWSMDIMQNGNDFWLIDMALAENSVFYDSVPKEKRIPSEEKWIPEAQE